MILIGTDFSPASAFAAAEARALASGMGESLTCLHVRIGDGRTASWEPNEEEISWLLRSGLDRTELDVRHGIPWIELIRGAEERRASIIVVGTHGHTGFQPIALGSTAARLALLSPVPTLLVGGRERPQGRGVSFFEQRTSPDQKESGSQKQSVRRPSVIRPGDGSDA